MIRQNSVSYLHGDTPLVVVGDKVVLMEEVWHREVVVPAHFRLVRFEYGAQLQNYFISDFSSKLLATRIS